MAFRSLSLEWYPARSPSNGIPQVKRSLEQHPLDVTIHNSLSISSWTSVDTFAIVHALLDCVDGCTRHSDKVCDLTHFASRTKKRRSAGTFTRLSLCGAILKYTTITNLFLRCHSHRESHGLNKNRIITAFYFFYFFLFSFYFSIQFPSIFFGLSGKQST